MSSSKASSPPPPVGKPPLPQQHHHRARVASDAGSSIATSTHGGGSSSSHPKEILTGPSSSERAELGLLNNLEHRRNHTKTPSGDLWHSSVEGERPPLHSVPNHVTHAMEQQAASLAQQQHHHHHHYNLSSIASTHSGGGSSHGDGSKHNLRDLARRVMELNRSGSGSIESDSTATTSKKQQQHRRKASRAHQFLGMIQEGDAEQENDKAAEQSTQSTTTAGLFENVGGDAHPEQGDSLFSMEGTNTDRLFAGASVVNDLFETIEETSSETSDKVDESTSPLQYDDSLEAEESLPLVADGNDDPNNYGSSASSSNVAVNRRLHKKKKRSKWQKMRQRILSFLDPIFFMRLVSSTLEKAWFLLASIPIFFFSWILYFYLDNPSFDFLPGNASLAWWVNLLGRLCLTLEIARTIQWMVIDNVVLGTRTAAKFLGPLVTLITIQGRGWPFVVTTWSLVNLFLLHGSHDFQKNWLLFITFGFDNPESEHYVNILATSEYLRIWLALIVAGVVTSAKRTAVAMYFGRRTFTEFKPRLEKLLREVVLVSEVAELALEIERNVGNDLGDTLEIEVHTDRKVKFLGDFSWSSDPRHRNRARNNSQLESDDESETSEVTDKGKAKDEKQSFRPGMGKHHSSATIPFKDLLDYWEEPINKMDRSMNASIQDILKFRRALTFMDEPYPFGEAFGPATTRDEVLASASNVYLRMVTSSEHSVLSCDVLYLLAEDDDGVTIDRSKKRTIRKLFHPDATNEVSMLSFVQACDSLYRRMRYFRASVGNASVIDHALESIVDGFYNFILCLVMLSILQINPWPLLVSISTLLVSVSFAVGPSAAKYIEGILLIAIRRPFDLGDRIYMHEPSVWNSDKGLDCSWFVEDINLFNTTIRYAGTNEVATLSNGSIAHMRIVNGNRSPNAMVWFQLPFNLSVLEEEKMASLKAFLEGYAKLRPHKWHSCAYCRADNFYPDIEKVVITIGFQSRSSWQDLSGVLFAKSDLVAATVEYGRRQGINYEELPQRQFHYQAGALQKGAVWKHRTDLHAPSNILSRGDEGRNIVSGGNLAHTETTPLSNSNLSRPHERSTSDESKSNELSPNSLFLSRLKQSHA